MTAAGFLLVLFGFAVAWYDDFDEVPRLILFAAAVSFWSGALLLLSGITTWLWRVMP